MRRCILVGLLTLVLCVTLRAARAADTASSFFLHDGDTVVFYGDSITEQQMYGRDIENYVVTRFPAWHIRFINSGWSGDRVTGGGGNIETRLKRDVLPYKPTVVTIFLGMNDGGYTSYDPAIFQTYAQGLTHIVTELQQKLPGVRLTLFTPSMFDYAAKERPEKPANQGYNYVYPAPDYNETLIRFGTFVKQLGAERHIPVVDLMTPMMEATARGRLTDPKFALSGDGVHPNEVGHLIMAAAVLHTWNAPGNVADLDLTPGKPLAVTAPLAWPLPDAARQAFAVSSLPDSLDIYRVRAANLPDAEYSLLVDGQPVGTLTHEQLANGVDLTRYSDLPANKQAQEVAQIVQDRIDKWHYLYKGGNDAIAHYNDAPSAAEVRALQAINAWLDDWRARAHNSAQSHPHTFELRTISAAK